MVPPERLASGLGASALLFGVAIVISLLTQLIVPFSPALSLLGLYTVVFTYVVVAVPFVFSGICVTLALTRFPRQLPSLYAVDLLGAAAGCAIVVVALDVTDGPTTVVGTALIACTAAGVFLARTEAVRLQVGSLIAITLLAAFVAGNSLRIADQASLLRVQWVKGGQEPLPLFEKWNSFSRVTVFGDPTRPSPPKGWGLSDTYPRDRGVPQLTLLIDAGAATLLTHFDGRFEPVEHLKYDVTNMAHWLRRDARVLVVGVGGGRDVLSALAFGQRHVVGVEINGAILDIVNAHFGGFTGQLDRDPRVHVRERRGAQLHRAPAPAGRHSPDLAHRHLGGHRSRRLRAERALPLHQRSVGALPRSADAEGVAVGLALVLRRTPRRDVPR